MLGGRKEIGMFNGGDWSDDVSLGWWWAEMDDAEVKEGTRNQPVDNTNGKELEKAGKPGNTDKNTRRESMWCRYVISRRAVQLAEVDRCRKRK
jgi:hypothetical protein